MISDNDSRRFDRRGFLGAATLLTLAEPARLLAAEPNPAPAPAPVPASDAAAKLEAHTRNVLRWQGPATANWVKPRAGVDHDVLVVGGGQSGLAIAYRLRRKGAGRIEVIDQAEAGQAGIWTTIARMHQLRTPKSLPGPEQENPGLGFRAWFETQQGPAAFDALDRIPREAWADYLAWFQKITGTTVRYRTRLVDIEPQGELLRVQLETDGMRRSVVVRKLVLATGYVAAGGPSVPGFLRQLPPQAWAHSSARIDFGKLAGKSVAVIGAGASAFDAAATALETGAAEVHLFSRDPYLNYTNYTGPALAAPPAAPAPAPDRGHAPLTEMADELPDEVRWRDFLKRDRSIASVPYDSLQRAVHFDNFHAYIKSEWTAAKLDRSGKVVATIAGKARKFDYVIAGTGYRIDLAAQPELAHIHGDIALWRDRYRPEAGEESPAGSAHPYLGAGFEFLPREGANAAYLRNIHCFNLAAGLSFGIPVGDLPSTVHQPTLAAAIAHDLFLADVDVAANRRFLQTPDPRPDPAPYQKALRTL
jgi:cation diffusion facilitator CzcD-associated flavoprotein CzcO